MTENNKNGFGGKSFKDVLKDKKQRGRELAKQVYENPNKVIINQEMADAAVADIKEEIRGKLKCPLINHPTWKCGDGLRKGAEAWCHSARCYECPSHRRYFDNQIQATIIRDRKRPPKKKK